MPPVISSEAFSCHFERSTQCEVEKSERPPSCHFERSPKGVVEKSERPPSCHFERSTKCGVEKSLQLDMSGGAAAVGRPVPQGPLLLAYGSYSACKVPFGTYHPPAFAAASLCHFERAKSSPCLRERAKRVEKSIHSPQKKKRSLKQIVYLCKIIGKSTN